jgi:hypothetical protein
MRLRWVDKVEWRERRRRGPTWTSTASGPYAWRRLNASSANGENARRRVGQPALGPRVLQLTAALQRLGLEGGRAEMRPHGICVISVFPDPVNDERNQMLSPIARATAKPLKERIKNDDPGEVAQDWSSDGASCATWRSDGSRQVARSFGLRG